MGSFVTAVGVFDNVGLCIKPRDNPFKADGANSSSNAFAIAVFETLLSSTASPKDAVVTVVFVAGLVRVLGSGGLAKRSARRLQEVSYDPTMAASRV